MNRRRQLALYTAVNIDGASSIDLIREEDSWSYDPRIAESEQIGEALYRRNKLDRGHLVRRLDPVWGTPEEAARANEDTFHFTNCSPQHEGFNQNDATWQGIENFLLDSARNNRRRSNLSWSHRREQKVLAGSRQHGGDRSLLCSGRSA
jgi:endonuclease G